MKVLEKVTKTEILILALAAAFLAALVLMYPREADGDYTVTTQRRAPQAVTPAPRERAPVDINTAGADELETLSGIGPALAGRIVDYREEHGPFQSVEELLEVSGIGETTLEKLRGEVTVGAPAGAAEEEE